MKVLCKVASLLNAAGITWAIGASLRLYFEHITDDFHDIDIMVHEKDVQRTKKILLSIGTMEFVVDGVDIDVMAGFAIVFEGKEYDCSLQPEQIVKYIEVDNVRIPLQSVSLWREYYRLMQREAKVEMIDQSHSKIEGFTDGKAFEFFGI